ncbi:MAG: glutamine-hydrolyzing carbamoyl-phosphate synthase small subunit [Bacteroidales bacterium]|nr:glutamine-hydrolyzing carbamoyl-phosphate synthase small subunit [Bacteroidales bacterium]
MQQRKHARLVLDDGSELHGLLFGAERPMSGEVVFNTAMTGYVESLTDPSYAGQIMTLTYPLIGNYGVPPREVEGGLQRFMESDRIYAHGLIVGQYSGQYSHWNAAESLDQWLKAEGVPAIEGIDTRKLTKQLRERGVMMGKILIDGCTEEPEEVDYAEVNYVAQASCKEVITYNPGGRLRVVLVDYGVKNNIIRSLTARGAEVVRVPWDYDFNGLDFDGLFLSNGPGNPEACTAAVDNLRRFLAAPVARPCMGICMGHQLLSVAAGAKVYKLKYGHRSHNQPVRQVGTDRCFVTSQNHGYCVDDSTLADGWLPLMRNLNDQSNEGVRHAEKPWFSVQFHPEACGGPTDTAFLFDDFVKLLNSK